MPAFARAVARLDHARDTYLAALDALTIAQRDFRPADGSWTAHEVTEHLMLVERGLVGGLGRQVAAGEQRRDVGRVSEEALDRVMAGLASGQRFQIPPAAAPYIAPEGTRAEQVRHEWESVAARWRALATHFPASLEALGLIRHPLAGAVTAEGAARFAAGHVRHHHAQLERITAADGFPARG